MNGWMAGDNPDPASARNDVQLIPAFERRVMARGRIDVDIERVQRMLNAYVSQEKIAQSYNVSRKTVQRWIKKHGLVKRAQTEISNDTLDNHIADIFECKRDAGKS